MDYTVGVFNVTELIKYAFDVNKFYLGSCTSELLLLLIVEHQNIIGFIVELKWWSCFQQRSHKIDFVVGSTI